MHGEYGLDGNDYVEFGVYTWVCFGMLWYVCCFVTTHVNVTVIERKVNENKVNKHT